MRKQEKSFFIQNLSEELKSATCLVLVDFTGLSVKKQQELKKRLAAVGAKMLVTKNTLFKLAAKEAKTSRDVLTDSVLTGPTALIIGTADAIAPLQVLGTFAREFEIPQFKVGILEGSFCDKETLIKLSVLPGKEALLGQLLGVLMRPSYGLVTTLQGNLQKLVYILEQKLKGPSEIA